MPDRRYVTLRAAADTAAIRTATHDGDEYLVVPVVALVGDRAIRPIGSDDYEFVPTDVLASAPDGWNGRPVVWDHPNGGTAIANEPRTLERMRYGWSFAWALRGGKLAGELWMDKARARRLGGEAQDAVERAERGDSLEVSVGALITTRAKFGFDPTGQRYAFEWTSIVPDHVATLPSGGTGACSNEMGCGAPRAALRAADKEVNMTNAPNLLQRWLARLGIAQEDLGLSDADLREALWNALRAAVPGFEGIEAVFPADGSVVYAAMPEDRLVLFQRSYAVDDGGEVTLSDDAEEVQQELTFRPVTAASDDPDRKTEARKAADCSCNQGEGDPAPARNNKEVTMTDTIKDLAGRLVANERAPFTDGDYDRLVELGEDGFPLRAMAEAFEAQETREEEEPEEPEGDQVPVGDPAPDPDPEVETKPMTEEEWLEDAPRELRSLVERSKREESARRATLVSAISKATDAYESKALEAKETDDLEALARALRVGEPKPDYSGRGLPVSAREDESTPPPPPDLYARIRKARGVEVETDTTN